MLVQSKKIKGRLAVLQRKREALDNHMETLQNSELNQHVLHSMQRTSNALKAMGLDKSLQSVDKVMLDLEENHNDMHSLQQSLGTSYTDEEDTDWGLELQMLMNDESLVSTPDMCNSIGKARAKTEDASVGEVVAAAKDTMDVSAPLAPEELETVAEKKAEHAVIE